MSDPILTEAAASAILRKLDERVRRIDTRVTLIGHTIGAPFNVNTKPTMLPGGVMALPSRHTTLADILEAAPYGVPTNLMLDGLVIGTVRKI